MLARPLGDGGTPSVEAIPSERDDVRINECRTLRSLGDANDLVRGRQRVTASEHDVVVVNHFQVGMLRKRTAFAGPVGDRVESKMTKHILNDPQQGEQGRSFCSA